jgi:hypothetical protein
MKKQYGPWSKLRQGLLYGDAWRRTPEVPPVILAAVSPADKNEEEKWQTQKVTNAPIRSVRA